MPTAIVLTLFSFPYHECKFKPSFPKITFKFTSCNLVQTYPKKCRQPWFVHISNRIKESETTDIRNTLLFKLISHPFKSIWNNYSCDPLKSAIMDIEREEKLRLAKEKVGIFSLSHIPISNWSSVKFFSLLDSSWRSFNPNVDRIRPRPLPLSPIPVPSRLPWTLPLKIISNLSLPMRPFPALLLPWRITSAIRPLPPHPFLFHLPGMMMSFRIWSKNNPRWILSRFCPPWMWIRTCHFRNKSVRCWTNRKGWRHRRKWKNRKRRGRNWWLEIANWVFRLSNMPLVINNTRPIVSLW